MKNKRWQTVTIDKDDFTFSVVYNLLKIKGKAYVFENIFKIPDDLKKHLFVWVYGFFSGFILIVLNF